MQDNGQINERFESESHQKVSRHCELYDPNKWIQTSSVQWMVSFKYHTISKSSSNQAMCEVNPSMNNLKFHNSHET